MSPVVFQYRDVLHRLRNFPCLSLPYLALLALPLCQRQATAGPEEAADRTPQGWEVGLGRVGPTCCC